MYNIIRRGRDDQTMLTQVYVDFDKAGKVMSEAQAAKRNKLRDLDLDLTMRGGEMGGRGDNSGMV